MKNVIGHTQLNIWIDTIGLTRMIDTIGLVSEAKIYKLSLPVFLKYEQFLLYAGETRGIFEKSIGTKFLKGLNLSLVFRYFTASWI